MKYDDASWHYGGDFPESSPDEYGATHIGLFLRWCFVKGWAGELHLEECPEEVQRVIAGSMSGTEFLLNYCDGKFTDEDLTEQGNAFAQQYYGEDGPYLSDYASQFADLLYVAPESAHDFQAFSNMVEQQLTAKNSKEDVKSPVAEPSKKPWWKRW